MGGIISISNSQVISRNFGQPCQLTLDTAPNLSFEEVRCLFPLCVQSWNDLFPTERKPFSSYLSDILDMHVADQMSRLNDNGTMLAMLSRVSKKNVSRNKHPVAFVLGYCAYHKYNQEKEYNKSISSMGREHARIGIDSYMLTDFFNVILTALQLTLGTSPHSKSILQAWASVFNYIYKQMIAEKFCFARSVDGSNHNCSVSISTSVQQPHYRCCPRCNVNHVNIGFEVCDICMNTDLDSYHSLNSVSTLNLFPDHRHGSIHSNHHSQLQQQQQQHSLDTCHCYPIQEGTADMISNKGAPVSDKNLFIKVRKHSFSF